MRVGYFCRVTATIVAAAGAAALVPRKGLKLGPLGVMTSCKTRAATQRASSAPTRGQGVSDGQGRPRGRCPRVIKKSMDGVGLAGRILGPYFDRGGG